ncbi:sigma factor [Lentzea sp. NPDC005914]|uniref:sigma factor n=1 Tax=Lentzea sp. NPDC005914 TaxID=3154572 RepID=UPI0034090B67
MVTRDEALISSLWETHGAALLAYATRVHGAKAEDVVHDVLIKAWREVNDLPPAKMAARAWLFAMIGTPKRGLVPVSFPQRKRTAQLV